MKFPSRNSRATGPKIRVPLGDLSSPIITAAFSSNLMYEPSGRCVPYLVRTTTAFTTSPFLTTPPGVACLTVATMMSPIFAVFTRQPSNILITNLSRAPELSATFTRLSCWLTVCVLLSLLDQNTHQCKCYLLHNNCFFNDF